MSLLGQAIPNQLQLDSTYVPTPFIFYFSIFISVCFQCVLLYISSVSDGRIMDWSVSFREKMKNSVLHCAFKKISDASTDNHTSGNEEAATC